MAHFLAQSILENLDKVDRFTVLDCGAYFGMNHTQWQHLGPRVVMHGFDAYADECERLNQRARAAGVAHYYHPACLAERAETGRPFYVTRSADGSSLFRPSERRLSRWKHSVRPPQVTPSLEYATVMQTVQVNTTTLDAWSEANGSPDVDFIKLDLQASDLGALKGGQQMLRRVVGIEVEVYFVPPYEDQPVFADIDIFLRQAGFSFFNFLYTHTGHFAGRMASPINVHYPAGTLLQAQGAGQLFTADALYLFDPIEQPAAERMSLEKLLKLAIVAEACQQLEFAFEILAWIRDQSRAVDAERAALVDRIIAIAVQRYTGQK